MRLHWLTTKLLPCKEGVRILSPLYSSIVHNQSSATKSFFLSISTAILSCISLMIQRVVLMKVFGPHKNHLSIHLGSIMIVYIPEAVEIFHNYFLRQLNLSLPNHHPKCESSQAYLFVLGSSYFIASFSSRTDCTRRSRWPPRPNR